MLRVSTTVELASSWLNAKYLVHKHRYNGNTIIKATGTFPSPLLRPLPPPLINLIHAFNRYICGPARAQETR